VALTLAENAIELGAAGLITGPVAAQKLTNDDGEMRVERRSVMSNGSDGTFELEGTGESAGTVRQSATAFVKGRIANGQITIEWSQHSQ